MFVLPGSIYVSSSMVPLVFVTLHTYHIAIAVCDMMSCISVLLDTLTHTEAIYQLGAYDEFKTPLYHKEEIQNPFV